MIDLLGVDHARDTFDLRRSPQVRLSWLREVYNNYCKNYQWECTTRVYLLHLVACIIFTNKSATLIRVSYFPFFGDLKSRGTYAWGVVALTHLYEQL